MTTYFPPSCLKTLLLYDYTSINDILRVSGKFYGLENFSKIALGISFHAQMKTEYHFEVKLFHILLWHNLNVHMIFGDFRSRLVFFRTVPIFYRIIPFCVFPQPNKNQIQSLNETCHIPIMK